MGNHHHLVLYTRQGNLSRLMRHPNGVYTQAFNRRHGLVGHRFQGRFKAILVDRDAYLLALCRYVERNPVAAGLVEALNAWRWSSCQAHLGQMPTPLWLDSHGLYGHLMGQAPQSLAQQRRAQAVHAGLVGQRQTGDESFWASALRDQFYLGDEAFADRMRENTSVQLRRAKAVSRLQRNGATAWAQGRARPRAPLVHAFRNPRLRTPGSKLAKFGKMPSRFSSDKPSQRPSVLPSWSTEICGSSEPLPN
jgi:hypothetical protein